MGLIPMIGKKFGRLQVIAEVGKTKWNDRLFRCKCSCGAFTEVAGYNLRKGHTQSCGCLQRERTGDANRTHGKFGSRVYSVWRQMIQRCHNPKTHRFEDYGGRGITVCDRWREDFRNFLFDMGEPPKGMSLERKDNNGPYSPENCRWASRKEQGDNKRNNVNLTFNGVTMTQADWSRATGLPVNTIRNRLLLGWSIEKTLATPRRVMKSG